MSEGSNGGDRISEDSLLKVCRLLNEKQVRYLVVGGFAVALHQVNRFTKDVDVLVEPSEDNLRRVIEALSGLEDGAARELSPKDFIENKVVKIHDEVEVDVSILAWVVTYLEAAPNALAVTMDGVCIPYLGLKDLIRSKQTYRDQDRLDIKLLCEYSPAARAAVADSRSDRHGCLGLLFGDSIRRTKK